MLKRRAFYSMMTLIDVERLRRNGVAIAVHDAGATTVGRIYRETNMQDYAT